MNFDHAIAAHTAWKKRFKAYLFKRDDSFLLADIASDEKCILGQWIHDEETRYSGMPEFDALKGNHARFHQIAAQLVIRSEQNPSVVREMELGANSDFTGATSAVVLALIAMKKRVAK